MQQTPNDLLSSISAKAFMPEDECMNALLVHCSPYEELWPQIMQSARSDIERLRSEGMGVSVESFLQEYSLSTKEGVALMCLAEALLRIPDRETADKLIESTFEGGNWESHLGHSESVYVNAASWGLVLTGKLIGTSNTPKEGISATLKKLVRNSSEPAVRTALRRAMKLAASQFVMGEDIESSLKKARTFEKRGYRFSYDMLGEGARSFEQAERYFDSYLYAIREVGKRRDAGEPLYQAPSVSIKLTALHPRYEWRHKEQLLNELLPKLKTLCTAAKEAGIGVAIDAEEATRLDIELELFQALFCDADFADYAGIGFVLQAYQKRALYVIDWLAGLSQQTGKRIPVRLVKGAYWDTEIKAAQIGGLPDYPVFTVKEHSDVSYLACAKKLLEQPQHFFSQFASHNAITLSAIKVLAAQIGGCDFEFQRLYGMGEKLYETIVSDYPSRIYAPIGEHKDLLAYLIRRLLENGANSSFVHAALDEDIPVEALLQSPIQRVRDSGGYARIAPPEQLYGDARRNSRGYDLGNRAHMQTLLPAIAKPHNIAAARDASATEIEAAIAAASAGFTSWNNTPAEARALHLERAADLLQENEVMLLALLQREGKKTLADAIAELREAIDFCRYYALQCRQLFGAPITLTGPTGEHNSLALHGRGVFACISPWNFPLAIFIGQITAALAAGNSVIAKPAEQTPAIAKAAVALLHEAGIPKEALQLVCGNGESVGAALVRDERVNGGICFTGSTAVAKIIQKNLANRNGAIIPLIAETGGQNAMIVDSSALLEQAVDDIIHSAFGSAGQRCSALRVLYVHADIADDLCKLIAGAMQALHVGDALDFTTDIPPVIDAEAQAKLRAHIDTMKQKATFIAAAPAPACEGTFVVPHAFEIENIGQLSEEHFGPILHVVRYHDLDAAIAQINAAGYGLTFGIHSRIPSVYDRAASLARAGNIYVNRGMTGAVVGVQPFGGEGLSGTGPKAGSPYTLLRFASEKAISINTAAIGGNIDLLMT